MKRAVLIRPGGHVEPHMIGDVGAAMYPGELKQLQSLIGGYVTSLPRSLNKFPDSFTVFCDEEGLPKRRAPNTLASDLFLTNRTMPIVGNVLVMGRTRPDGATEGLTVEQANIFLSPNGEDILNALAELS